MKHSPTPWTAVPDQASHGCVLAVVDANNMVLFRTPEVEVYDCAEQQQDKVNAAIAAAAPQMLAALRALLTTELFFGDHPRRQAAYTAAREAVEAIDVRIAP